MSSRPPEISADLWQMTSNTKRKQYLDRRVEAEEPLGEDHGGEDKVLVGVSAPRGANPKVSEASNVDEPCIPQCAKQNAQCSMERGGERPPWELWEEYAEIDAPIPLMLAGATSEGRQPHQWPSMPCSAGEVEHRPKLEPRSLPYNACVARTVNKAEIAAVPKAKAAMKVEWDRLRKKHVWNESVVREWDDVADEARVAGKVANLGYLFGICVEKNSEQPEGHPSRKFKGRVVFQGNRVVDQNWQRAIFEDLGNSPATMDASRAAVC